MTPTEQDMEERAIEAAATAIRSEIHGWLDRSILPRASRACAKAAISAYKESIEAQERNWPEDFSNEGGSCQCTCQICDKGFLGHKRRSFCKKCELSHPIHNAQGAVRDNSNIGNFWMGMVPKETNHDKVKEVAKNLMDGAILVGDDTMQIQHQDLPLAGAASKFMEWCWKAVVEERDIEYSDIQVKLDDLGLLEALPLADGESEEDEKYRLRKVSAAIDYPECSGAPESCPENEGYGCCDKYKGMK